GCRVLFSSCWRWLVAMPLRPLWGSRAKRAVGARGAVAGARGARLLAGRRARGDGWRTAARTIARRRELLIVCMAVVLPVGFLILQRATLYDGIRHVLFVIPMLAILAGLGLWALLPLLRRAPVVAAVAG